MAGMWKQHELWDGTYSFSDLLDIHELLNVQAENQRRAQKAAENRNRAAMPIK